MYFLRLEMGICWSEPPPPPIQQAPVAIPLQPCKQCGAWSKMNICERCLQRNANAYLQPPPSAPPYQYGYTYAQQPQQQQMYYYQPPVQYPPQQRQMGTGTAMATGFVVGALMEDILDPTE